MIDYEQLIEQDLIAYQTRLDSGISSPTQIPSHHDLPPEIQQRLRQNRECLDFLDQIQKSVAGSEFSTDQAQVDVPLPDRIDRFLIKSQLGSGGFGIVFRAVDPSTHRDVAIKIPRPEILMSREQVERFRREAKAAAQLDHPNILAVYGSGEEGITPYIVMPFIDGHNLAEWQVKQTQISPEMGAEIICQLSRGVAHAHSRGVLHRDLKPANVLLDSNQAPVDGVRLSFTPKLMDFGLAKLDATNQEQTQTGTLLGTTSYMAPEQAEGRNRDISAMSDIFSLGVMLYELLTGTHPFRGETPIQTLEGILKLDPPTLRNKQPRIPVDLEAICLKCLEKSPERRYQSASDLADDLQRFLDGKPVQARPISRLRRFAKWCRRRPAIAAVALVASLSLVALVAISLSYNSRLTSLLNIAEAERTTVREQALVIRRRACLSDVRLAQIAWDLGDIDQAIKLLKRHIPGPSEEDVRHFAWWQLWRDYQDSSIVIGRHRGGATSVSITHDGTMAASAGMDTTIRMWTLPEGKLITELHGHEFGAVTAIDFSPDGTHLVSAGEDGSIRIWNVAAEKESFTIKGHQREVLDVAYAPDGNLIASVGIDHVVRLWDPQTGEQIHAFTGHTDFVIEVAFHPYEPLLASTSQDGTIRLWDLLEFCPDHRISEGIIRINKSENWCRCLTFSPDGTSLVASSIMADIFQWSWKPNDYGKLLHAYEQRPNARRLFWPRGSNLFIGDVYGDLYEVNPANFEVKDDVLKGHLRAVNAASVAQNTGIMLSASADETVRLWKTKTFPERLPWRPAISQSAAERDRLWTITWTPEYLVTRTDSLKLIVGGIKLSDEHPTGVLDLYSIPTGEHVRAIPIERDERHATSASGNLILITHRDGSVKCFRPDGAAPALETKIHPFPIPEFHTCRQIIDHSEEHALLSWGGDLIFLSLKTGSILQRMRHPGNTCEAIFLTRPGNSLAAISTCDDGCLRIWDLETGDVCQQHRLQTPLISVALSNDQKLLAVGGMDGRAIIYRFPEMKEIATFLHPDSVMQLGFFDDNNVVITRSVATSFWSLKDEQVKLLEYPREIRLSGANTLDDRWKNASGPFAFSPDGKVVAIALHNKIKLVHAQGRPE